MSFLGFQFDYVGLIGYIKVHRSKFATIYEGGDELVFWSFFRRIVVYWHRDLRPSHSRNISLRDMGLWINT